MKTATVNGIEFTLKFDKNCGVCDCDPKFVQTPGGEHNIFSIIRGQVFSRAVDTIQTTIDKWIADETRYA